MEVQENGAHTPQGVTLPRRVTVAELLSSRYDSHINNTESRPDVWGERVSGVDKIRTEDGHELLLQSDGQQSPPRAGWVILLTSGSDQDGFSWTLYGMPPK
jgi:hypothetical protein